MIARFVALVMLVVGLAAPTTAHAIAIPTPGATSVHSHDASLDTSETVFAPSVVRALAPAPSSAPSALSTGGLAVLSLDVVAAEGSLQVIGEGFSDSELSAARTLSAQGKNVVLREATGVGRTSDLLVDGVPYNVYTPTTGNLDRIVSAIASKGSQVNGGGVVLDLSKSSLAGVDPAELLARVRGVTSNVSDIIVIGN